MEQIQAQHGDNYAVVMLGYCKEMKHMYKNVNPVLWRCFQLEHAYKLPDYNDASLLQILHAKSRDCDLSIPMPIAKLAVCNLARACAKPNFGNGGAIDFILSQAKECMQKGNGTLDKLVMEDFSFENIGLDKATLSSAACSVRYV